MTDAGIERVRHGSFVFALALSRDERLLACGGDASVSVWDVAAGAMRVRLEGAARQIHALAFSPDGSELTGANLWGARWTWRLADGVVVSSRPAERGRRRRCLSHRAVDAGSASSAPPVMHASPLVGGTWKVPGPDGHSIARSHPGGVDVVRRRRTVDALSIEELRLAGVSGGDGIAHLAWSSGARTLGLAGLGWVACWWPGAGERAGAAVVDVTVLQATDPIAAIAVRCVSPAVLVAHGPTVELVRVEPRTLPAAPRPANFPSRDRAVSTRRDWTWNESREGYDGVRIEGDHLLWYRHNHNTMDGGSACEQTFASFLESGPSIGGAPANVLVELGLIAATSSPPDAAGARSP